MEAFKALHYSNTLINELLYGGGARGGKSYFGCAWQITRRIELPGSVGFIAREELTKLKDTTMKTFVEVLKDMHLEDVVEIHWGDLTAHFPNGSMIYFRELKHKPQDPEFDRLGSYGITDLFIDEAQQVSAKAISVLKGRFSVLRGKYANGKEWYTIPKALYTCNPKRNWIYTDFVKPAIDGTLAPHRMFIKALPLDNPYTDQAYIDLLLKADKITVQRLYFGNFEYDDDPAALCDLDAINDLFTNDHVMQTGLPALSADLAMKGRDRFVTGKLVGGVCTIIIDKVYSPGKMIENDLKNAMVEYGVARSRTVVDSDGLGAFLESYLNGIKEFHGKNPPVRNEYDCIKSDCGFKLAELINKRQIKIVCTDEQRERIKDELGVLKQAELDNDTKKKAIIRKATMKVLLGHSPDYLDMLIMLMIFFLIKPAEGMKKTRYK